MPALLPSELPIRAQVRQHWIVLFRVRHRWSVPIMVLAAIVGYFWHTAAVVFLVIAAAIMAYRIREWRAENVLLTGKRVIHVSGTVETTTSEASLRVDRISGLRLIETPLGKLAGYANLEIEAPGDHPGLRRLFRIASPSDFYDELRHLVYGEPGRPDPHRPGQTVLPADSDTAPLPRIDDAHPPRLRHAFRRR